MNPTNFTKALLEATVSHQFRESDYKEREKARKKSVRHFPGH
jgi:hypothetical protein